MRKVQLIFIIILCSIGFAYLFGHEAEMFNIKELASFFSLIFRTTGAVFCGFALMYSLLWLDLKTLIYQLKRVCILVFGLLLMSTTCLLFILYLFSNLSVEFHYSLTDIYFDFGSEKIRLLNPIHLIKKPIILWLIFCLIIGSTFRKIVPSDFQVNAIISILMSVLETMIKWLELLVPVGIFIIWISDFLTLGFAFSFGMLFCLLVYSMVAFVFVAGVIPIILKLRINIDLRLCYRLMLYPCVLAFSVGDAIVATPFLYLMVKDIPSDTDAIKKGQFSGLFITASYIFLPFANFFLLLFPLLILKITGQSQSFFEYFNFFIIGTLSLTSPFMVPVGVMSFLFDTLKIPSDATVIYATVTPLLKHLHAFINVVTIGTVLIFIFGREKEWREFKLIPFLKTTIRYTSLIFISVFVVYFSIPYIYKYYQGKEFQLSKQMKIQTSVETLPYNEGDVPLNGVRSLSEIINSKVLRVGFNTKPRPFIYQNSEDEIVGFDIEMAHMLARDLDCMLQLIPLNYADVVYEITAGKYDIGMAGLSMTIERLKKMNYTSPVVFVEKILVVMDFNRDRFKNLEEVKKDKKIRIAYLKGSSFKNDVELLFPDQIHVPIDDYNQLVNENIADALFWTYQQAYQWIRINPQFTIVPFKDSNIQKYEIYAYALSYEAKDLAAFLNHWLLLKHKNQVIKKLEKKWQLPSRPLKGSESSEIFIGITQ